MAGFFCFPLTENNPAQGEAGSLALEGRSPDRPMMSAASKLGRSGDRPSNIQNLYSPAALSLYFRKYDRRVLRNDFKLGFSL